MYPSIILLRIKQLVSQSLAFEHHKYAKKKKKRKAQFSESSQVMGHFRLYFFKGISCIVVLQPGVITVFKKIDPAPD